MSQQPSEQQYTEREVLEARAIEWESAFNSQLARSATLVIEINRLRAENLALRAENDKLKKTPVNP